MSLLHTILQTLWLQAAKKGVSDTTSGVIFGMFALVQFITFPIFGKLVSRPVMITRRSFSRRRESI